MRAREFKAAVKLLFTDGVDAAERLGVLGGKARISEWTRGTRKVPLYIEKHIETLMWQREAVKQLEWAQADFRRRFPDAFDADGNLKESQREGSSSSSSGSPGAK